MAADRWGAYGAAQPKQNVLNKICHAILSTKTVVEFRTVYLQTGWKKVNEEYVFLMPNAGRQISVELQGKLKNYSFNSKCSQDDLIYLPAMLENSFATQNVMLPLLAMTFMCPLNHFLKTAGYEPKFGVACHAKRKKMTSKIQKNLLRVKKKPLDEKSRG